MVKSKGMNLESVKVNNQQAILKLLYAKGAMSRKDIAAAIGLSPATVTLLSQQLIMQQVLIEMGSVTQESQVGRRKVLVDINGHYKYVFSLRLDRMHCHIFLLSMKGDILDRRLVNSATFASSTALLESIAQNILQMLQLQSIDLHQIMGVGVSMIGPVDSHKGISLHAYGLWSHPVPIKEILETKLAMVVLVENNIKAFAIAEMLYGSGKNAKEILFLKWGPGVGAALIIHNKIYQGYQQKATQIAHYTINPNGKPCLCGRKGCLEQAIAIDTILAEVQNYYTQHPSQHLPFDPKSLNIETFLHYIINVQHFSCIDSPIQAILLDKIKILAQVSANIIALIDPQKSILFGQLLEIPSLHQIFIQEIQRISQDASLDIQPSHIRLQKDHMEGLAIIIEAFFLTL